MRGLLDGCFVAGAIVSLVAAGCCKESSDARPSNPAAEANPASTASASATPGTAAPGEAEARSANPLATLLTGEPPAGVSLVRIKSAKGQDISARVPLGWSTSRDDPSVDYVDDEVQLDSKDNHASVWISVGKPIGSLSEKLIEFNSKRVHGSKVKYDPPVDGRFGKNGWEAKIAQGKGEIMKRPAEFWYMLAKTTDGKGITVFASARSDVYPKRRDETLAVLRSVFGPK